MLYRLKVFQWMEEKSFEGKKFWMSSTPFHCLVEQDGPEDTWTAWVPSNFASSNEMTFATAQEAMSYVEQAYKQTMPRWLDPVRRGRSVTMYDLKPLMWREVETGLFEAEGCDFTYQITYYASVCVARMFRHGSFSDMTSAFVRQGGKHLSEAEQEEALIEARVVCDNHHRTQVISRFLMPCTNAVETACSLPEKNQESEG